MNKLHFQIIKQRINIVLSLLFYLFFFPKILFSQVDLKMESLMTRHVPTCFEIALNSFQLIPSYYQQGKIDSAMIVLDYWNRQCERGITQKTRIIFALSQGKFSEDSLPPHFVYFLARNIKRDQYNLTPIENEYLAALDSYEKFLSSLSYKAMASTKPKTVEYLLSRHFSGNTKATLNDLQSIDYLGTKLRQEYDLEIESIKNSYSEFYYGIGYGSWLPLSKELHVFGPRPELSLTLFSGNLGINAQLYFALRFGPSTNKYTFSYKRNSYTTNDYTGFSMGFEILPRINISAHNDFSFIAGLMIDGYSPPTSVGNVDDKGANSINATIGLKYGYKLSPWGTPVMVLELRLNPFLVNCSGLDAPLGSSATLRFSVFFGSDNRAELLDRFSYYD